MCYYGHKLSSKGEILTSVLGIIAEFNPLHNGHQHLIHTTRKMGDFSATIAVMSGNFLQRGDAALCNKWVRTQMALRSGIDLVIELPFPFAVRSAYYFARGAIELLERTGVVSHLAFGSESGQLDELQAISHLIAHESQEYKTRLKQYLSQGFSYPLARAKTIQSILGTEISNLSQTIIQPNNILALEYLRVLEELAIRIKPITIARKGSAYHSLEPSPFASASAIRHALLHDPQDNTISASMPSGSLTLLQQEIQAGRAPVELETLGQSMLVKLRTMPLTKLREIYEINEGLEYRIQEAAMLSGTLKELRQTIKSKRYSLTRINRTLLYALLDLDKEQMQCFDQLGPLYLHILGFSTKGIEILQEIKYKSSVRILNRGTEVKKICHDNSNPAMQQMINLDVRATDIYTLLYPHSSNRRGYQDFTTSPIYYRD